MIEEQEKRIKDAMHATLGLSASIKLVEPRSLPRAEGKAARVIDVYKRQVAGGGYFIGSLCHRFFTVGVDMPSADYIVPNMLKAANLSSRCV